MAYISYGSVTETSVRLRIAGLNSSAEYEEMYMTIRKGSNSSGTFIDTQDVDRETSTTSEDWNVYGLESGTTYWVYFYIRSTGGSEADGSTTFTTDKARPNNWSWDYSKSSGSTINLTANEWNDFCDRINEFRDYKDLSDYSFTNVYRGDTIRASYMNQARSAISSMSPSTSLPPSVSSGDEITAYFFNRIRDSLNSID